MMLVEVHKKTQIHSTWLVQNKNRSHVLQTESSQEKTGIGSKRQSVSDVTIATIFTLVYFIQ